MLIYGGHSARLRGQPLPREDSDIDIFLSQEELVSLQTSITGALDPVPVILQASSFTKRYSFIAPRLKAPATWRRIEVEIIDNYFNSLIQNLPDNFSTTFYDLPCLRSSQATDCMIKLAAIEKVPGCDIKHQQDLQDLSFDVSSLSSAQLDFLNYWRTLLEERYS